jgi:hypothetical protein
MAALEYLIPGTLAFTLLGAVAASSPRRLRLRPRP